MIFIWNLGNQRLKGTDLQKVINVLLSYDLLVLFLLDIQVIFFLYHIFWNSSFFLYGFEFTSIFVFLNVTKVNKYSSQLHKIHEI